MNLVVVKIVILNQCGAIESKIMAAAAMLSVLKRESCRFAMRMEKEANIYSRSNLGIYQFTVIRLQGCTVSQKKCRSVSAKLSWQDA